MLDSPEDDTQCCEHAPPSTVPKRKTPKLTRQVWKSGSYFRTLNLGICGARQIVGARTISVGLAFQFAGAEFTETSDRAF
jgi:hypothetical protein